MSMELSKGEKLRVILDSNALFVPLEFKIDIFEEIPKLLKRNAELILVSPVKRELQTLTMKGSPQMRKKAMFALKLADKCSCVVVDEQETTSVDDAIVQIAKKWRCPVFTNDKQLKDKLKHISVPVIYVRQKSHLEINGMI